MEGREEGRGGGREGGMVEGGKQAWTGRGRGRRELWSGERKRGENAVCTPTHPTPRPEQSPLPLPHCEPVVSPPPSSSSQWWQK